MASLIRSLEKCCTIANAGIPRFLLMKYLFHARSDLGGNMVYLQVQSPEEMEGICELDSPDSLQQGLSGVKHDFPTCPVNPAGKSGLLQPTDPTIPSIMLQQPSPVYPEKTFLLEPEAAPPPEEDLGAKVMAQTLPPGEQDGVEDSTFVVASEVGKNSSQGEAQKFSANRQACGEETMDTSCILPESQGLTETSRKSEKTELSSENENTEPPDEKRVKQTERKTVAGAKKGVKDSTKDSKARPAKSKSRPQVENTRDTDKVKSTKTKPRTASRDSTPTRTSTPSTPTRTLSTQRKGSLAQVSGKKTDPAASPTRRASQPVTSVSKLGIPNGRKAVGAKTDTGRKSPVSVDKAKQKEKDESPTQELSTSQKPADTGKRRPAETSMLNLKLKKEVSNNGKKKAEVQGEMPSNKKAAAQTTLKGLGKVEPKLRRLSLDSSAKNFIVSPVISATKANGEHQSATKRPPVKRDRPGSKVEGDSTGKDKGKVPAKARPVLKKSASLAGSRTPSSQSIASGSGIQAGFIFSEDL